MITFIVSERCSMQEIIRIDLGGVNSYLVKKDDKFMLVDTGGHLFMDKIYSGKLDLLLTKLVEHGVTKNNLSLVVLTHGDCDHVFNSAFLQKEYHAKIAIHQADADMIQQPKWDDYKVNLKYESKIMSFIVSLMNKKIEALMHAVFKDFIACKPDVLLEEGCDLSIYGFDGIVYHTPGHTPGSICILDSAGNLLCGDLFANNKKPAIAVNAMDFHQLKNQASRMRQLSVKKVYPGHGNPFVFSEFC